MRMRKQIFPFICLLLQSFLSGKVYCQLPQVSAGQLIRHAAFASKFVSPRNIDVWLPEGYERAKRYPVLYVHDGQMLFDSTLTWNKQDWQLDEWLSGKKGTQLRQVIVVAIWNDPTKRHAEYFPQKPFESLTQPQKEQVMQAGRANGYLVFQGNPIQSDAYLRFLVEELKPFIDATYRTLPERKHTMVMGSSMGALISLYALCEYPDVFGAAACLSTHWPGIFSMENNPVPEAFFLYLRRHLPSPRRHRIYFDYGDQTLDAMYPPLQREVDLIMHKKKYRAKHWRTAYFAGAEHSEQAWAARLGEPLRFLLGGK